jgi:hypothetical protein
LNPPFIADTGGFLRALARNAEGQASFPEYESVLRSASLVIVPALVLAEIDDFLRNERRAMRKLVPSQSTAHVEGLASPCFCEWWFRLFAGMHYSAPLIFKTASQFASHA